MKADNNKYVIGVDVGTQSAKVSIFDLSGNVVSYAAVALQKLNIPAPLLAEHPEDDIWESTKAALKKAIHIYKSEKKLDVNNLLSMGICIIRLLPSSFKRRWLSCDSSDQLDG